MAWNLNAAVSVFVALIVFVLALAFDFYIVGGLFNIVDQYVDNSVVWAISYGGLVIFIAVITILAPIIAAISMPKVE